MTMNRYMIDKFMRVVQLDRVAFRSFCDDRARYVNSWLDRQTGVTASELPTSLHTGALDDDARDAFVSLDIGALYQAGAHPYMLWHFAVDVLTEAGHDRSWIIDHYQESVGQLGYPDHST